MPSSDHPPLENRAKCDVSLTVNGELKTVRIYPMERLLDTLREQLGLTGAKEGCGEGECGSCSVLMDGALVNSCLIPVLQASGASITTIEGLGEPTKLHGLQKAFLECGGAQCGICTPGMILAAFYLLLCAISIAASWPLQLRFEQEATEIMKQSTKI